MNSYSNRVKINSDILLKFLENMEFKAMEDTYFHETNSAYLPVMFLGEKRYLSDKDFPLSLLITPTHFNLFSIKDENQERDIKFTATSPIDDVIFSLVDFDLTEKSKQIIASFERYYDLPDFQTVYGIVERESLFDLDKWFKDMLYDHINNLVAKLHNQQG